MIIAIRKAFRSFTRTRGSSAFNVRENCFAWLKKANGFELLTGVYTLLVSDKIQDTFQCVGRDPDLAPGVIELRTKFIRSMRYSSAIRTAD